MKNFKILAILLVMVGLLVLPLEAKAAYNHTSNVSKVTDSDNKSVYTYNLMLDITGSSEINHIEGKLILENLEVVSFTANPEFSSEFANNAYSMTSNRYFTASDSGFTYATVVVKQINAEEECNFGFEPLETTKVNVNEFTITKEAFKDGSAITEIKPNEEFEYKITVTSLDNALETNEVVVTDVMPSGLEIISVDNNGVISGNSITWNLGAFPAGSKTITLTIKVRASETLYEIYTNTASLSVANKTIEANNSVKINDSNVSINKTVSETTIQGGTEFYYTIEIQNNGTSKVSDIKVEDIVDSNLVIVNVNSSGSLNGNTVTWTFSLEAGAKKELILTVRANKDINVASIKNSAVLTYDGKTVESNIAEVNVELPKDIPDDSTNDPTLPKNPNTGTTLSVTLLSSVGIVSGLVFKKTKHKDRIYRIR